jgi:aminoglycoside phosphotransferase (APT) family kinase protein
MNYDTTIERDRIEQIVSHVTPEWELREATPATGGHHAVYHLELDTGGGTGEFVLKATPPEKDPVCGEEARLLSLLDRHTEVPVPEVYGVADDHEALPTPLFLAAEVPGENPQRTGGGELSATEVRTVARSMGRHLASLHSIDAVDAYGPIGVQRSKRLDGERPTTDPEDLTVESPVETWTDYLTENVEGVLTALEDTRFAGMRSTVEPVLFERIDALEGPFEPALCRIDASVDNLVLDAGGEVAAQLDWEFQLAATPAYDLAFVEHSLAGGNWSLHPEGPDHREAVREGLLAGYREVGPQETVDRFRRHRGCYALLAETHTMINFDSWYDLFGPGDGRREDAADNLRELVRSLCGDDIAGP